MKNLLFIISLALPHWSLATDRIQAMRFDRSQVATIYLAPGMGSMVLFPCSLIEVFVGRNEDLKAQISPNDKKTLLLNLKITAALPTNLIARCEGERNLFVFDVYPSKTKHQDIVDIKASFGGPRVKESLNLKQISKPKNKYVLKSPTLIKEGQ